MGLSIGVCIYYLVCVLRLGSGKGRDLVDGVVDSEDFEIFIAWEFVYL